MRCSMLLVWSEKNNSMRSSEGWGEREGWLLIGRSPKASVVNSPLDWRSPPGRRGYEHGWR